MESSKSSNMPSGISKDIYNIPDTFSLKSSTLDNSNSMMKPNDKSSYMRIGIIIIILLFLGINIFSYLGDILQSIKEAFAPLLKKILESLGYVVTEGTKDITQLTASGAKLGIDVAAGTIESGIDVIQGQIDVNDSSSTTLPDNSKSSQQGISSSLSMALADAEDKSTPLPDDATSSTQRVGSGKSGYCYIGEDRGFRSCINVKEGDVCMSGEIFPSQEICINPSLRE